MLLSDHAQTPMTIPTVGAEHGLYCWMHLALVPVSDIVPQACRYCAHVSQGNLHIA